MKRKKHRRFNSLMSRRVIPIITGLGGASITYLLYIIVNILRGASKNILNLNSYVIAGVIIAGVIPSMISLSWRYFNEKAVMSSEVIGGTIIDNLDAKRRK